MRHRMGALSTSISTGFLRLARGFGSLHFGGGNLMSPCDCSSRSRLRQTMSLSVPFACRQSQALQTSCEMKRLLPSGWSATICLTMPRSPSVILRPRYVVMISMHGRIKHRKPERKKNRTASLKKQTGINFDGLVKSRKCSLSVIPAKAGIQCPQALMKPLDPVFQRGDDFLRSHQGFSVG